MQDGKTMAEMLNDHIRYFAVPSIKYAPEIGTHISYDIMAYDHFERDIVATVWDVTQDRDTALHIAEKLTRYKLSPLHLEDAIHDMLN